MITKLEDKGYIYEKNANNSCQFRLPPEITNKINEIIGVINYLTREVNRKEE